MKKLLFFITLTLPFMIAASQQESKSAGAASQRKAAKNLTESEQTRLNSELRRALDIDDFETAQNLFDSGAYQKRSLTDKRYYNLDSMLEDAVEKSNKNKINFLLHNGANINATALRYATPEIRKNLLDSANPVTEDALRWRIPDIATVQRLLEKGANIAFGQDGRYESILNYNISNTAVLEFLILHGVPVNQPSSELNDNISPLLTAIEQRQPESVRLLLQHRANPQTKDILGNDAYTLARQVGNQEIIKILEEHREGTMAPYAAIK